MRDTLEDMIQRDRYRTTAREATQTARLLKAAATVLRHVEVGEDGEAQVVDGLGLAEALYQQGIPLSAENLTAAEAAVTTKAEGERAIGELAAVHCSELTTKLFEPLQPGEPES